MRSITVFRVVIAGTLALQALVPSARAKAIMVDSYDAGAFVRPARHFADRALGSHLARFSPILPRADAVNIVRARSASAALPPAQASFASLSSLSDLYKEGRRFAHEELSSPPMGDGTTVAAPRAQNDFWAMLTVGAGLVAYQLRRKHRSLKPSLISG
ncbi:MAG TPA: hypothetical protein VJQ47_14930 [Steroidobacteraceae bacterium]|nr:hypothetical protein [Steroidobacteraceae bacterium]